MNTANDPDREFLHQEEFGLRTKIQEATEKGKGEVNFTFSNTRSQSALIPKLKSQGFKVRNQYELTFNICWR